MHPSAQTQLELHLGADAQINICAVCGVPEAAVCSSGEDAGSPIIKVLSSGAWLSSLELRLSI